eukprot:m.23441 g.23441  ORF g.23441 m.23441 type:complete len:226 (+) comp5543_c1_seq2:66-743(+)
MSSDYNAFLSKRAKKVTITVGEALEFLIKEAKSLRKPISFAETLAKSNFGTQKKAWRGELLDMVKVNCEKLDWNDDDETIEFRPKYNVSDKEELVTLLQKFNEKGLGAIIENELEESYSKAVDDVAELEEAGLLYSIKNPATRQTLLFFRRTDLDTTMDEEIVQRWRQVGMKGVDIKKELLAANKNPVRVEKIKIEEDIGNAKGKRRRNKKDRQGTRQFLEKMLK